MTFINLYVNKYKLSNMCAVLEISKRIYYKYRNADDSDYLDYLMIKNVFNKSKGTYGYRRITEGLKIEYGVIFNHKKVARIMKKYYLKPEYIKRLDQILISESKKMFNLIYYKETLKLICLIKNGQQI